MEKEMRSMNNGNMKSIFIKRAVVFAVCMTAFAVIAYLTKTNRISPFDDAVRGFIYNLRTPLLSAVIIPITYLGNWQTITGMSALLILIRRTRFRFGFSAGGAALTSDLVNKFVKKAVKRARPPKSLHLISQGGYSFPSGHSMTGLVFYGMIIYAIRKKYGSGMTANIATAAIVLLVMLIGLSRIYVGVHYPSDVLGGWCLGTAFLMIAVTVRDQLDASFK